MENDGVMDYAESNEEVGVDFREYNKYSDNQIPVVGMLLDSDMEAYNFYNRYAKTVGFSVRKNSMYRNAAREIMRRDLTCSWEGFYKQKTTPVKKRDERRSGCKAMMMIRLNDNKKYVVTEFVEEHNHPLVDPTNAHMLRSHRRIDLSQKDLIQNMSSSGIGTNDIMGYLSTEAGGAEYLNFLESDLYNVISRTRLESVKEGDAQCLLDYLSKKEEANKFFFYKLKRDEHNRLCRVFIADAKSRSDYHNFGDVMSFDTTFRTNGYNMICAPLVGVNHHGQTVLFGCGLLADETIPSFEWLFKTFLEAMGGKHPETIFTDQAPAIGNAISTVFPNTHHRFCLWHIYLNAAKCLKYVFEKYPTVFANDFRRCIYNPETVDEFEESWKKLLSDYGVQANEWLKNLYKTKTKWAQVYGHEHFCAGMTTTQRSESINKFLKKFFSGNLILREFVSQFDKALNRRRLKERLADTNNKKTKPTLSTLWVVEREASEKYTRNIFKIFQEQCIKSLALKLELLGVDGETRSYSVRLVGKANTRKRTVTYTDSTQLVSCSCKKFEFQGILCKHILKLFLELEVSSLPSVYYLKRWTMEAATNIVYDSNGEVIRDDLDPEFSLRFSEISHCAQTLVGQGARSKRRRDFAISEMLRTISTLEFFSDSEGDTHGSSHNVAKQIEENFTRSQSGDIPPLRNPVRKKRFGPKARIKGVLETKSKKSKRTGKGDKNTVQATSDEENRHFNTAEEVALQSTQVWFPRLHVNDTEKGGPRAPPRNKMALYEQLSIPAQRSASTLPTGRNTAPGPLPPVASLSQGISALENGVGSVNRFATTSTFSFQQLLQQVSMNHGGQPQSSSFNSMINDTEFRQGLPRRRLDFSKNDDMEREATKKIKVKRSRKKNTRPEIILKNEDLKHKWENVLGDFNPLICDMIESLGEVTPDGHCGYRSIATLLGYTDDLAWKTIRGLMLKELMQYADYYTKLYGHDVFENHKRNLECTKSFTMNEKEWLDLPDMGSLVASAFNVAFVTIAPPKLCVTYFPLRTGPEELFRIIVICHINKGTHFVPVVLKDIAPLPPVWRGWQLVRLPEAAMWKSVLQEKLGRWDGSVPTNMQKLQYVYLE